MSRGRGGLWLIRPFRRRPAVNSVPTFIRKVMVGVGDSGDCPGFVHFREYAGGDGTIGMSHLVTWRRPGSGTKRDRTGNGADEGAGAEEEKVLVVWAANTGPATMAQ